jgi:iron complex outermembrane receptor protein
VLVSALTPLASHSALAQETTAQNTGSAVETVTVTARKRTEALKDVPVDVTAINADTIMEQHIVSAKDIAAIVPGLNINSDSVGRSFIDIRGVGTTLLDSVQPGVGIFVDGIYEPVTSYLNTPLVDVEQVEVLKGPQGTLFGNNTLGGAINIITRQPTDEFRGRVDGSYAGPDNYGSVSGSMSGPIIPGELQARIGFAYHTQDGFITQLSNNSHYNPLQQTTLNTTLRWEPANNATITMNAYYDRVHGGLDNYYNVAGPHAYSSVAVSNRDNLGNYTYSGVNLKGVFDVSQLATQITAIGAFDHRDNNFGADDDFGPFNVLQGHGAGILNTGTGELRFDTKWNDQISSLVGFFYDSQYENESNVTTLEAFALNIPSYARLTTKNFAAYGTVFWNFAPDMEFTAGLRWDHQTVTAVHSAVAKVGSNQLEPRFTLDKHWTPDVMTYVSVARGYRGGGINPPFSPNPAFKGDSVWTYETGVKAQFFDNRLSIDAAAFYNDYYNFIGQNSLAPARPPGAGFVGINLNSGRVSSPGVEVQAVGKVTDNWTLSGGATYVHGRIINGSEYVQTTGLALPSDRILFLPDWNFNVDSDYVVPIGPGALDFDAGLVAKGDRKGSSLAPHFAPTLSEYFLVNGSITWRQDNWDVSLWATNLFDQKYWESYIDISALESAGLPPPIASNLGILGDKRRVGVSVTYRF